jgi:hypothetical protein
MVAYHLPRSEIERIFHYDVCTDMYTYRDGSNPPFPAMMLRSECIKIFDRAMHKLADAIVKARPMDLKEWND